MSCAYRNSHHKERSASDRTRSRGFAISAGTSPITTRGDLRAYPEIPSGDQEMLDEEDENGYPASIRYPTLSSPSAENATWGANNKTFPDLSEMRKAIFRMHEMIPRQSEEKDRSGARSA